jgi:hypothetical protein
VNSEPPAHPDLVKVTEIFLVPSSFLVAALGTADTNIHRACVSLLGLIISVLWWLCSLEAAGETVTSPKTSKRRRILIALSVVFMIGWLASSVIHALLWNRPLGVGG